LADKVESVDYFEWKRSNKFSYIIYAIKLLLRIRHYDAFLVFNPDTSAMIISFINKIIWRKKTTIIFFDTLLHAPYDFRSRIVTLFKSVLLNGADGLFCVHKDTLAYKKYFGLKQDKFYYIPFKANNYHLLEKYPPKDGGYALSCGASYRDFDTFLKAIRILDYPTKIVLPAKDTAKSHNTCLDERDLPENVEVIRHNYDCDSWNEYIANARLVVIPIQKRALQPAGISVYLEAMALSKPVIITEGASTRGILTRNEAEIVPSEDALCLARAMKKIWEDKDYRDSLAENGKKYALSLKGEERLVIDILEGVCLFVQERQARSNLDIRNGICLNRGK
jgi:glycosyltransferase involved in cell wall biosynthesis